jgi:hypothetical protein
MAASAVEAIANGVNTDRLTTLRTKLDASTAKMMQMIQTAICATTLAVWICEYSALDAQHVLCLSRHGGW